MNRVKMGEHSISYLLRKAKEDLSNVQYKDFQTWIPTESKKISELIRQILQGKEFRIKEEPNYAPYKSKDALEFLGKIFVSQKYGLCFTILVSDFDDEGVFFVSGSTIAKKSYDKLYYEFEKHDGTPAGRMV